MKFTVDLQLDGYDEADDAEVERALTDYIIESLDFSASSVTVHRFIPAIDEIYCACPPSVPKYDSGDGWTCNWCRKPRRLK